MSIDPKTGARRYVAFCVNELAREKGDSVTMEDIRATVALAAMPLHVEPATALYDVPCVTNLVALVLLFPDVVGEPRRIFIIAVVFGEINRKSAFIAVFTKNGNIAVFGEILQKKRNCLLFTKIGSNHLLDRPTTKPETDNFFS